MKKKPTVSVVMITYGHEKYIREAIEGVLMQEGDFELELIVANDCSPDDTDTVVHTILKEHPRASCVRYFKHEENKGMMANFVFALQQATGKYIALCDGDDYWTDPYKIQKQVDFLEANNDYSLSFTRFKVFDDREQLITDDLNSKYFNKNQSFVDFNIEIFAQGWHVGTQTLVFKKEKLDLKILNKYKYFRDVHLFVELLKYNKGACLNFFGAIYRKHDGGVYTVLNEFEVLKTGVMCYKELYYNNKDIKTLRQKFDYFNDSYIGYLIVNSMYYKALKETLFYSIQESKYFYLMNKIIAICKKILTKEKNRIKSFFQNNIR